MTKDLLVRGFDDEIHTKLGDVAGKMGVSLNSIVKDAVDKGIIQNQYLATSIPMLFLKPLTFLFAPDPTGYWEVIQNRLA